jgi:two-component system, cell cycle sensor histidine kinase and response regulator CckA
LLTLSRKEMVEIRPIDVNRLIGEDLELLRRLMGEHIETKAELEPGLGAVLADPGQVHQILLNLAANARDAMPAGGRLTLATRSVDVRDGASGSALGLGPGTYVRLEVADTGLGIDRNTQKQIFDPFFTTKRDAGGSGLGLSIVNGIVRQLGGAVTVDSEPGRGAKFQVYFPASEVQADAVAAGVAVKEPGVAGGDATVLVVEDQEAVRRFACMALDGYGFRILEAEHGAAALELARQHDGPIHLLLTDVIMPNMNGRELAERIVPLRPQIKVLYMSGYTEDVMVQRGLMERGFEYIAKPFAPQALAQKVTEALGRG